MALVVPCGIDIFRALGTESALSQFLSQPEARPVKINHPGEAWDARGLPVIISWSLGMFERFVGLSGNHFTPSVVDYSDTAPLHMKSVSPVFLVTFWYSMTSRKSTAIALQSFMIHTGCLGSTS